MRPIQEISIFKGAHRVSGPLAIALIVPLASIAAPAAAESGTRPGSRAEAAAPAARCRIASYYRIDSFRRRNFYIPGTRYVDGPGGEMRVWVMRSYTVRSEFEIEDWNEREWRRFFHARGGPRDFTSETVREVARELVEERSANRSGEVAETVTRERPGRESGEEPDGEPGGKSGEGPGGKPGGRSDAEDAEGRRSAAESRAAEREHSREERVTVRKVKVELTREEERELLRAMRLMISPLISDDHTVEAGHEYVRKISDGKYGYLRYRVFGYRVGFSKWWRGDDCRVHRAATGVAGVPARVEGWVYRERKRPNPKWLGVG